MSGGVDSTVAAALLARDGYEVVGVTFRIGSGSDAESAGCCSARHACDAAECATLLGVKHFVDHVEDEFHRLVVEPFADAYASGRTPNPCIACNRHVRFPALVRLAGSLGTELVATGHYARVERDPETGRYCVARGADPAKDQSYVLYALEQEVLGRVSFPVGALAKSDVRRIAEELGLPVARKPESQDICFVSGGDYRQFLARAGLAPGEPGPIVDRAGNVLGRHRGVHAYTVGQRRGLAISGAEPLYVLSLDPATNTVVAGSAEELLAHGVRAGEVVFGALDAEALREPCEARIQVRYHGPTVPGLVEWNGAEVVVRFSRPAPAGAPGQSVVCYDAGTGTRVLCGGVITAIL